MRGLGRKLLGTQRQRAADPTPRSPGFALLNPRWRNRVLLARRMNAKRPQLANGILKDDPEILFSPASNKRILQSSKRTGMSQRRKSTRVALGKLPP